MHQQIRSCRGIPSCVALRGRDRLHAEGAVVIGARRRILLGAGRYADAALQYQKAIQNVPRPRPRPRSLMRLSAPRQTSLHPDLRRCPEQSRRTVTSSSPRPRTSNLKSSHFRLDRPPEFAHSPNRPHQTGLRESERILLISEPAHEAARFHPNQRFRTQPRDDRPDI